MRRFLVFSLIFSACTMLAISGFARGRGCRGGSCQQAYYPAAAAWAPQYNSGLSAPVVYSQPQVNVHPVSTPQPAATVTASPVAPTAAATVASNPNPNYSPYNYRYRRGWFGRRRIR